MITSSAPLSLSALGAAVELRNYLRANPEVSIDVAIESLCAIKPGASSLDFENGLQIHQLLPDEHNLEISRTGLREAIRWILEIQSPSWMKLIPSGRDRVRAVLRRDEIQCLREAGLFDAVPDGDTLAWWDILATKERAKSQVITMEQAREAERFSFEQESVRLASHGTDLRPEWVSLEDNSLGYDIRSYSLKNGHWTPFMIEVKSTKDGTFFVSRNEWKNAVTSTQYIFHVWQFPCLTQRQLSVSEVSMHIPVDQGNGSWESARIRLDQIRDL